MKVVLLDSDPMWSQITAKLFAQLPNVKLYLAELDTEGLQKIRAILPDLILLDLHPVAGQLHGLELLEQIKLEPATQKIPVVMLSADYLRRGEAAALQMGALAYLEKPLTLPALRLLLKRIE